MEIFTPEKLEKLVLVEKSLNRAGSAPLREDLPEILYHKAPRIIKGVSWFNKESIEHKPFFGQGICECCGKEQIGFTLHRHELYGLYKLDNDYIAKYEGILVICDRCHRKIHGMLTHKKSKLFNPYQSPISESLKNPNWSKIKGILIYNEFYPIEELC